MYTPLIPSSSSAPLATNPCFCAPSFRQSYPPSSCLAPSFSSCTAAVGAPAAATLLAAPSHRRCCAVEEAPRSGGASGGSACTGTHLQALSSRQQPVSPPVVVRHGGPTEVAADPNSKQVLVRALSSAEVGGGERHFVKKRSKNSFGASKPHPPVSICVRDLRDGNQSPPTVASSQLFSSPHGSLGASRVSERFTGAHIFSSVECPSPDGVSLTQPSPGHSLTLRPGAGDGWLNASAITEKKKQQGRFGCCLSRDSCGDGARFPGTLVVAPRDSRMVREPAELQAVESSSNAGAALGEARLVVLMREEEISVEEASKKEDAHGDASVSSVSGAGVASDGSGVRTGSLVHHAFSSSLRSSVLSSAASAPGGGGDGVFGSFPGSMEGNSRAANGAIEAASPRRKEKVSQERTQKRVGDATGPLVEETLREVRAVSMTSWSGRCSRAAKRDVYNGTMTVGQVLEGSSKGSVSERGGTAHRGGVQESLGPGHLEDAEDRNGVGDKREQATDDAASSCHAAPEASLRYAEGALVEGDFFSPLALKEASLGNSRDCATRQRRSVPSSCLTDFSKAKQTESAGHGPAEINLPPCGGCVVPSSAVAVPVASVYVASPASPIFVSPPPSCSLSPRAGSPLSSPAVFRSPENATGSSVCESHCLPVSNRPAGAGERGGADVSLPLFAILSDEASSPYVPSSLGACSSSRCSSLFSTSPSPSSALPSCASSSPAQLTPSCSSSGRPVQHSPDRPLSGSSHSHHRVTSQAMASCSNQRGVATMNCSPADSQLDFGYGIDASRGAAVSLAFENFEGRLSSAPPGATSSPVLPSKLRHPEEACTPGSAACSPARHSVACESKRNKEAPAQWLAADTPCAGQRTGNADPVDVTSVRSFPAFPVSRKEDREGEQHGKQEEGATVKDAVEPKEEQESLQEKTSREACLVEATPAADLPGVLGTYPHAIVEEGCRNGEKEEQRRDSVPAACRSPGLSRLPAAGEQPPGSDHKDDSSEVRHGEQECPDSLKSTEVSSVSTSLSPSPPSVLNSPIPTNGSSCSSAVAHPDHQHADASKLSPNVGPGEGTASVLRRAGTSLGLSDDLPHKTVFPFQEDQTVFGTVEGGRRRLSSRSPREEPSEKQQALEAELAKLLSAIEAHVQASREKKPTKDEGAGRGEEGKKEASEELSVQRTDHGEGGAQVLGADTQMEGEGRTADSEQARGGGQKLSRVVEERPCRGLWADKEALIERVRCVVARMDSGISMDLRGRTWKVVLGVEQDANRDALLSKAVRETALDEPNQRVIRSDVERTRASLAFYRDACNRAWMERLLTCYCKTSHIKYKQGLNELLAPFLYLKDRNGFTVADVFHCFQAFVNRFLSAMFCDDEFTSLQCAFHLFKHLLTYHDPALSEFLENQFVTPELYVTPWFLTLFSSKTSLLVLFALWDKYLVENDQYFFPFIGLALLICFRKDIMKTEVSQLPETLSKITIHSIDQLRQLWSLAKELKTQTPMSFSQRMFASQGLREAFPQHLQQLESESAFFTFPQEVLNHAYGLNGRPTGGPSKPPTLSLAPRFLSPSNSPSRGVRGETSRPPLGTFNLHDNHFSEAAVSPPSSRLVAPPVHVPPQWKMLILDLRPVWLFESGRLPPAIHIDLMSDWRAAIAALLGVYDPQQQERGFFLSDSRHSSSPSSLNLAGLRQLAGLRSSRVKHKTRDNGSSPGLEPRGAGRSSVSSACSLPSCAAPLSSGVLDRGDSHQQFLGCVPGVHSNMSGVDGGGPGTRAESPRLLVPRVKGGQGRDRGGSVQCSLDQRDGFDHHEGRRSRRSTASSAKESSGGHSSQQLGGEVVTAATRGEKGSDEGPSHAGEKSPARASLSVPDGEERARERASDEATSSVMLPQPRHSRSAGGGGASKLLRGFRRRTQQILGPPSSLVSSSVHSAPSRVGSGEAFSAPISSYQDESLVCTRTSESEHATLLSMKGWTAGSRRGSVKRRNAEDKETGEPSGQKLLSHERQVISSVYTRRTYPSVRSSRARRLTALPHSRPGSFTTSSTISRWTSPVQSELGVAWDTCWKDQKINFKTEEEGDCSEEVSDFHDEFFSDDPALYRTDHSAHWLNHFFVKPGAVCSAGLGPRAVAGLEAWRSLEKWDERTRDEQNCEVPGADEPGRGRVTGSRVEDDEGGTGKKKRMWGFRAKASASREKRQAEGADKTKDSRSGVCGVSRCGGERAKGTGLVDVRGEEDAGTRDRNPRTSSETGEKAWSSLGTRRRPSRCESHFLNGCVLAEHGSVPRRSRRLAAAEEKRLHTRRKLAALRRSSQRHGLVHRECMEPCPHLFSDSFGKRKEEDGCSLSCSFPSSSSLCCLPYRKCFSDGDVPPSRYFKSFRSATPSCSTPSRDLSISNPASLPSSPPAGRCKKGDQSLTAELPAGVGLVPEKSCTSQVSPPWLRGGTEERHCDDGRSCASRSVNGESEGEADVKPYSPEPSRASSPDADDSRVLGEDSSGKERTGSECTSSSSAGSCQFERRPFPPKEVSSRTSPLRQLLEEEARLARERKDGDANLAEESSSSTDTADEDEDQSPEVDPHGEKRLGGGPDGEGSCRGRPAQFLLSSLILGAGTASPRFFYSRGLSAEENAKAFKEEKVQIPSHHVCLITADEKSYQDAMEVYRVLTQEMGVRWVSIAKGGYRACHDLALKEGLELVDHHFPTCPICTEEPSADNGDGTHSHRGTNSRSSSSARGSRSSSVASSLSSPVVDVRSTSRLSSPAVASGPSGGASSGFLGAMARNGSCTSSTSSTSHSRPVSSKRGGTSLSSLLPIRVGLSSSSPRSSSPFHSGQLPHSGGDTSGGSVSGRSQTLSKAAQNESPAGGCLVFPDSMNGGTFDAGACSGVERGWEDREGGAQSFCASPQSLRSVNSRGVGTQSKASQRELSTGPGRQKSEGLHSSSPSVSSASSSSFSHGGGGSSAGGGGIGFGGLFGAWRRLSNATTRSPQVSSSDSPHVSTESSTVSGEGGGSSGLSGEGELGKDGASVVCCDTSSLYCGGSGHNAGWPACPHHPEGTPLSCLLGEVPPTAAGGGNGQPTLAVGHFPPAGMPRRLAPLSELPLISYPSPQSTFFLPPFCPQCQCALSSVGPAPGFPSMPCISATTSASPSKKSRFLFPAASLATHSVSSPALLKEKSRSTQTVAPCSSCPQCGTVVVPWCCSAHSNSVVAGPPPLSAGDFPQQLSEHGGRSAGRAAALLAGEGAFSESSSRLRLARRRGGSSSTPKATACWGERGQPGMGVPSPYPCAPLMRSGTLAHIPTLAVSLYYLSWRDLVTSPHTEQLRSFHCYIEGVFQPSLELLTHARQIVKRRELRRCRGTSEDEWGGEQSDEEGVHNESVEGRDRREQGPSVRDQDGSSPARRGHEEPSCPSDIDAGEAGSPVALERPEDKPGDSRQSSAGTRSACGGGSAARQGTNEQSSTSEVQQEISAAAEEEEGLSADEDSTDDGTEYFFCSIAPHDDAATTSTSSGCSKHGRLSSSSSSSSAASSSSVASDRSFFSSHAGGSGTPSVLSPTSGSRNGVVDSSRQSTKKRAGEAEAHCNASGSPPRRHKSSAPPGPPVRSGREKGGGPCSFPLRSGSSAVAGQFIAAGLGEQYSYLQDWHMNRPTVSSCRILVTPGRLLTVSAPVPMLVRRGRVDVGRSQPESAIGESDDNEDGDAEEEHEEDEDDEDSGGAAEGFMVDDSKVIRGREVDLFAGLVAAEKCGGSTEKEKSVESAGKADSARSQESCPCSEDDDDEAHLEEVVRVYASFELSEILKITSKKNNTKLLCFYFNANKTQPLMVLRFESAPAAHDCIEHVRGMYRVLKMQKQSQKAK